jgi:hypothetical protein
MPRRRSNSSNSSSRRKGRTAGGRFRAIEGGGKRLGAGAAPGLEIKPRAQWRGIFGIARCQSSESPGGLSLLAMLVRESVCRTSRHQFRQLAARVPVTASSRHSKWVDQTAARAGRWTPLTGRWHSTKPATKYRKGSGNASRQYPVEAGWPEEMKRGLQNCRTADDHHVWAQKWSFVLRGDAARLKRRLHKPPPPCPPPRL